MRWGVTATNPVDRFEIEPGSAPALVFDNLAVRLGLAPDGVRYTIRWAALDNTTGSVSEPGAAFDTAPPHAPIPLDAWGPADASGIRYAVGHVATDAPGFVHWAQPVRVTVRNRGGILDVVGIERPTDFPAGRDGRR